MSYPQVLNIIQLFRLMYFHFKAYSDPSKDTYRRDLMNEISRQRLSRDLIIVQPLEEQKISNTEFIVSNRTVIDNPRLNATHASNNQLKVDSVEPSIRRRPRSPVGVQEWVASLPIPSEMASPPSDFELMSDQTLENAHIVSGSNNCLSTSSQEKLKYQEKQSLCKKVSYIVLKYNNVTYGLVDLILMG